MQTRKSEKTEQGDSYSSEDNKNYVDKNRDNYSYESKKFGPYLATESFGNEVEGKENLSELSSENSSPLKKGESETRKLGKKLESIQISWDNVTILRENEEEITKVTGAANSGELVGLYDRGSNEDYQVLLDCLAGKLKEDFRAEGIIYFNSEVATREHYVNLITFVDGIEEFYSKAKILEYLECLAKRRVEKYYESFVNSVLSKLKIKFDKDDSFEKVTFEKLILFYVAVAEINRTPILIIKNLLNEISNKKKFKVLKKLRPFTKLGRTVIFNSDYLDNKSLEVVNKIMIFKREKLIFNGTPSNLGPFVSTNKKSSSKSKKVTIDMKGLKEFLKNSKFEEKLLVNPISISKYVLKKTFYPFCSLIEKIEKSYFIIWFVFFVLCCFVVAFVKFVPFINISKPTLYPCVALLYPSASDVINYLKISIKEYDSEYFSLTQYIKGLWYYNFTRHLFIILMFIICGIFKVGMHLGIVLVLTPPFLTTLFLFDLLLTLIHPKKGMIYLVIRKTLMPLWIVTVSETIGLSQANIRNTILESWKNILLKFLFLDSILFLINYLILRSKFKKITKAFERKTSK